jgi:putative ABC transport system ATP-binding protein
MIKVKNLKKEYRDRSAPTKALNGLSFSIDKGEFVAIMGPSGSGKSTLMHILGFLDLQTEGTYQFEGREILEYSHKERAKIRNKRMGFVFQMFNLLPRVSVLENVKLPLIYSDIPKRRREKLAKRAIEAVSLTHRISHPPNQLSGGEQQRVAIARALVNDPSLIFADEPTGNLPSESGKAILDILKKLNSDGRTVILVTHEEYVAKIARRVIYMSDGKIVKDERA